jgi:hypothetical protein
LRGNGKRVPGFAEAKLRFHPVGSSSVSQQFESPICLPPAILCFLGLLIAGCQATPAESEEIAHGPHRTNFQHPPGQSLEDCRLRLRYADRARCRLCLERVSYPSGKILWLDGLRSNIRLHPGCFYCRIRGICGRPLDATSGTKKGGHHRRRPLWAGSVSRQFFRRPPCLAVFFLWNRSRRRSRLGLHCAHFYSGEVVSRTSGD